MLELACYTAFATASKEVFEATDLAQSTACIPLKTCVCTYMETVNVFWTYDELCALILFTLRC